MTADLSRRDDRWLARNRTALLLLLPLAVVAVAASSYQYRTFYLANEFSNVTKASGPELAYSEQSSENRTVYKRAVTLRVASAEKRPLAANPEFPGNVQAAEWTVTLQFSAKPDVPLDNCGVALLDAAGRVYNGVVSNCVPRDAPGPQIDFLGKLEPVTGPARPSSWTVEAKIVMPTTAQPAYVRVSWKKPNAALLPLP